MGDQDPVHYLGETDGDALSMSMNLGYLVSTSIFSVLFAIAVTAQIYAKRFNPLLYWTTELLGNNLKILEALTW